MNKIAIFLIKMYQKFISKYTKRTCRFHPTCSQYAIQSFKKYNFFKAFYLTTKRILKCHPLSKGGYDPLL